MKTKYELGGVNCSNGMNNVKWAFLQLPEVQEVDVHLDPQSAVLTTSKPFAIHELQAHLSKAGDYTIKEIVS
jgi:copper chaperone CopZ